MHATKALSSTLPMSEWRHLPGERGVCVSSWLDGEKSVYWLFFKFLLLLLFFVEHSFLASLSLCFRVQCVLSGVLQAVLVQNVLMNVCAIMEATVIQKKANVSVMQATREKGLHNFKICILLYFSQLSVVLSEQT